MTILFHFTAHRFVSDILNHGIHRGVLVDLDDDNKLTFTPGYQWLTENNSYAQSWCETSTKPYRRNEVRIALEFDEKDIENIIDWLDLCTKHPNQMRDTLNSCRDPENWYLYKGNIDISKIKAINFNPEYVERKARNAERFKP